MEYNVYGSLESSARTLSGEIANVLPMILMALAILVVGWIVAGMLKGVTIKLFTALKINEALDAAGVDKLTERAGHKLNAGKFMGTLVKWFVIAIFFVAALDVVGLNDVTYFIRDVVLGYLPKVIVAVLILMVAAIVAKAASGAVASAVRASGTHKPVFFEKLTYYSILTFAVLAALNELQIATELIETLFMGVVFALALALGLSFGLGGKDAAARYIDGMTKSHSSGGQSDHH